MPLGVLSPPDRFWRGCRTPRWKRLWWEGRILEIVDGLAPDAPAGSASRPEFDPLQRSLTERERAKAAELAAGGHQVTASTVGSAMRPEG